MLSECRMEPPQGTDGTFTVFPLTVLYLPERRSLTLDEALEQGRVEVVESGDVPDVVVHVEGDAPVLVLEGEVLTGGWQNRTVNISLLLDPGRVHRIPVSCVERGRWSSRRFHPFRPSRRPGAVTFDIAACALPAELRRSKTRSTVRTLRHHRVARSDQAEVWAIAEAYLERTGTDAPTRDVTAYTARYLPPADALLAAVEPLDRQVGAVVAIGGRVAAIEVLDHPETWRRLHRKVLRSYALDALEARETASGAPSPKAAQALWEDVARAFERATVVPAPVGLGEHRLLEEADGTVQGFALVHAEALYHLLAFRNV